MESIVQSDALKFISGFKDGEVDLVVSSPPYFIGKEYDSSRNIEDFIAAHELLAPELARVLKPSGAICWQVGNHVWRNVVTPLDALVYAAFARSKNLVLRNRIVWTFGHGAHCARRFSGRHETILWFSKTGDYHFDLDSVRVPQKYPGKRHYKGPNHGKPSGNPRGKNPGDVWEIPNVKAGHVEKTDHPCQFPVALAQRLVRALCPVGGVVIDPYLGAGSTAIAAAIEKRQFYGCDIEAKYVRIARNRVKSLRAGTLKVRALNKPVSAPNTKDAVARTPKEWLDRAFPSRA